MTSILLIVAILAAADNTLSELSRDSIPSDTLVLPGITVTADRFDLPSAFLPSRNVILLPDSVPAFTAQTAGDLLNRLSAANVRSYGPGLAQTVSIQGFSGSQISVMWEDVPLNNPMLGLTDLSLYPSVMIDRLDVNAHQGSAEYGAHAIGGVIQLRQHRLEKPLRTFIVQSNTLSSRSFQGRVAQPIGKWYLDVGGVYQYSPNRFPYDDITQNPVVRRTRENAHKELASVVAQVAYSGLHTQHSFRLWATDVRSGIPGPIVGASPNAGQHDAMLRVSNRSNWVIDTRTILTASGMFSRHRLDFRDPDSNINSLSASNTISGRISLRFAPRTQQQVRVQGGYSYSTIDFSEYDAPDRHHGFLQINYYAEAFNIHIHPSVRYDLYNQFGNALTASVGLVRAFDYLNSRLFANASRNFAPPTFNDLYWPGLGNTDLVPEASVKFDVGYEGSINNATFHIHLFNNYIENGIQWLPAASDGQFRPDNIRAVRSRGVSAGGGHLFRTGGVSHRVFAEFTWLDARYISQRFPGDDAKGNQLVYQPRSRSLVMMHSDLGFIEIHLHYHAMGSRSVTEDNLIKLPSNHLFDLGIARSFSVYNQQLSVSALVENILNRDYELIRFYPMPGMHLHFSLKIDL